MSSLRPCQGHGQARDLHRFGQNATQACSSLGGALCENHARILQTNVVKDGRKMVAKSVVDGKSCLPSQCIQDADLRMLAGMLQRKAVETLGPASVGQQPVEVGWGAGWCSMWNVLCELSQLISGWCDVDAPACASKVGCAFVEGSQFLLSDDPCVNL